MEYNKSEYNKDSAWYANNFEGDFNYLDLLKQELAAFPEMFSGKNLKSNRCERLFHDSQDSVIVFYPGIKSDCVFMFIEIDFWQVPIDKCSFYHIDGSFNCYRYVDKDIDYMIPEVFNDEQLQNYLLLK